MLKRVDLHTHSTISDGTYTPEELMEYAAEKGLSAIALTDHDTTDGLERAAKHIKEKNLELELVPGIEISSLYNLDDETLSASESLGFTGKYRQRTKEIHVVGLFIDYHDDKLQDRLKEFKTLRTERNNEMCKRLTEASMPVSYEILQSENRGAVITRAHYAKYLLKKGYIKNISEAFEKYIGEGCPCFVQKKTASPFEVCKIILEAHGVPVLAHPLLYRLDEKELRTLITGMKEAGLIGIEALYATYSPEEERFVKKLASEYDLKISGGSDFHGANKAQDLGTGFGNLFIPQDVLEKLRK